ncbi:hypothetical protein [Qipengyuania flava]|uniref:hypothetical protein n=1 Tax=Qipengyuania flava TaxID=192812 RepID=UPI001C62C797|nr:hypothetical protein [Qipengyuania flava]QYJ06468.1 hypothetical protein KUV82_10345 [Qipengyuania flava]
MTGSPLLADFMRKEVGRLSLIEPLKSSPVGKKLLSFLVERSLASSDPISQYEVAEAGLDKPSDGDDSYPRVQVSRLRRMLSEVYAKTYTRNPPDHGLYIYIPIRDYRASAAPLPIAYPDLAGQSDPAPVLELQRTEESAVQKDSADPEKGDEDTPLFDYLQKRVRIPLGKLYFLYLTSGLFFMLSISLFSILMYVTAEG